MAVAIEIWSRRDATNNETIINKMATHRSDTSARLKNAHHITIANPPRIPANTPVIKALSLGTTIGITNLISHWSITMTIPGHNRSGFCQADP